ncbi:hypothetical protein V512_013680 [Mesotoga sp. Brook.08.105.5.1]|nr:hypothetical protein V512_013680 [Mesotoga sp. Brook.08.105.5.1]RAO97275.1 hypothetical protein M388_00485 [Mesotoga sp. Brook.08.YT.4.2.5.4.]
MKRRSMKEVDRMISKVRESAFSSLMTRPRF